MLKDIVEATWLEGYRVRLRFEDGVAGDLDLSNVIRFDGIFAPLKDPIRFRELRVHPELGTIYWPNGADLDPRDEPQVRLAIRGSAQGIEQPAELGLVL